MVWHDDVAGVANGGGVMAHIIPIDLRNRTVEERFERVRTYYEQAYKKKFRKIPKEDDVNYLVWAHERLALEQDNHFKSKPGLKEKFNDFKEKLITKPTASHRSPLSLEKRNDILGSSESVWPSP